MLSSTQWGRWRLVTIGGLGCGTFLLGYFLWDIGTLFRTIEVGQTLTQYVLTGLFVIPVVASVLLAGMNSYRDGTVWWSLLVGVLGVGGFLLGVTLRSAQLATPVPSGITPTTYALAGGLALFVGMVGYGCGLVAKNVVARSART